MTFVVYIPPSFGDETATGQMREEYRGLRRVTIHARIEDSNGFEWLIRFREQFLPTGVEPKSPIVIEIANRNARAKDIIYSKISPATIVTIDLADFLRDIITVFADAFRIRISHFGDPIDIISKQQVPREIADAILRYARENALERTIISRIEWVLLDAAKRADVPVQAGVINRNALSEMSGEEMRQLIARFSSALGESLRPDKLTSVIENRLEKGRLLSPGHVATLSIEAA